MVASQQKTLKATLPLHQLHATENPDQPTDTHQLHQGLAEADPPNLQSEEVSRSR